MGGVEWVGRGGGFIVNKNGSFLKLFSHITCILLQFTIFLSSSILAMLTVRNLEKSEPFFG